MLRRRDESRLEGIPVGRPSGSDRLHKHLIGRDEQRGRRLEERHEDGAPDVLWLRLVATSLETPLGETPLGETPLDETPSEV